MVATSTPLPGKAAQSPASPTGGVHWHTLGGRASQRTTATACEQLMDEAGRDPRPQRVGETIQQRHPKQRPEVVPMTGPKAERGMGAARQPDRYGLSAPAQPHAMSWQLVTRLSEARCHHLTLAASGFTEPPPSRIWHGSAALSPP